MYRKLATAMAIALLAATAAVGAGQSENTTNTTTMTELDHAVQEVQLDPATIHEAILVGEPFELPTPGGPVTVQATERTQETISYQNAKDQEQIVRPPNVWRTTVPFRGTTVTAGSGGSPVIAAAAVGWLLGEMEEQG